MLNRYLQTGQLLMLLTTVSSLMISCQNGNVTLKQLDIKIDGISFDSSYSSFTTPKIQSFSLSGKCSKDISQVFFRFNSSDSWIAITSANGSVNCSADGSFHLNFDYPINAVKASSSYIAARNGSGPQITLEFYGKTKEYKSKTVPLTVTQLLERGKNHLTIAPESQMQSPSFKIRGRLSQFSQPTSELTSTTFKIQNGSLRPTQ